MLLCFNFIRVKVIVCKKVSHLARKVLVESYNSGQPPFLCDMSHLGLVVTISLE